MKSEDAVRTLRSLLEGAVTQPMLDVRAYCDESESSEHLILLGLMEPFAEWEAFGEDWVALLEREGLTEFHAHDCAQGWGEFAGRSNVERNRLTRAFLEVIQTHHLHGVGLVLEMSAWPKIEEAILFQSAPELAKPWIFAFAQLLPLMAVRCPSGERIDFLFDDKDEFQFRAHQGFHFTQVFDNPLTPQPLGRELRARLGRLAFDTSKLYPGLQAADALAYEMHLRLRPGRPQRQSWSTTMQQMGSMTIGHIEQSVANRLLALSQALSERGVRASELTAAELADITRSLPPIAPPPSFVGDLFSVVAVNPQNVPPISW